MRLKKICALAVSLLLFPCLGHAQTDGQQSLDPGIAEKAADQAEGRRTPQGGACLHWRQCCLFVGAAVEQCMEFIWA